MVAALGEAALPPEVFRLLRDLIYDYCGIFFAEDDARTSSQRRLQPRLEALGARRLRRLLPLPPLVRAASARAELEEIVERVTTNETYFFRESYQLDAFRNEILPAARTTRAARQAPAASGRPAARRAKRRTRSPCSSTRAGLFDGWDVRVFGNDISRRVLAVARKAAATAAPRSAPPTSSCCAATSARSTASTRCATRCARWSASARSTCSTTQCCARRRRRRHLLPQRAHLLRPGVAQAA